MEGEDLSALEKVEDEEKDLFQKGEVFLCKIWETVVVVAALIAQEAEVIVNVVLARIALNHLDWEEVFLGVNLEVVVGHKVEEFKWFARQEVDPILENKLVLDGKILGRALVLVLIVAEEMVRWVEVGVEVDLLQDLDQDQIQELVLDPIHDRVQEQEVAVFMHQEVEVEVEV